MAEPNQIREHAEVIGVDGLHVGTVDHMEGSDRIKLTRNDPAAGNTHHYIPTSWVKGMDGDRVKLNKTAQQARDEWENA